MKKDIVTAVGDAKAKRVSICRSLEIIMLPKSRYYDWVRGRDPEGITPFDLEDGKSAPKCTPHRITPSEREAIVSVAKDDAYADLSHRKLAVTALDEGVVAASRSTWYRVMREVGLTCEHKRAKPKNLKKPEIEAKRPNKVWQYDVTYLRLISGIFIYIVFILDRYSRKIVGARASHTGRSEDIIAAWDTALAGEGLLDVDEKPFAFSDRGPEMKAKSTREYFRDIGISQDHARPPHPQRQRPRRGGDRHRQVRVFLFRGVCKHLRGAGCT